MTWLRYTTNISRWIPNKRNPLSEKLSLFSNQKTPKRDRPISYKIPGSLQPSLAGIARWRSWEKRWNYSCIQCRLSNWNSSNNSKYHIAPASPTVFGSSFVFDCRRQFYSKDCDPRNLESPASRIGQLHHLWSNLDLHHTLCTHTNFNRRDNRMGTLHIARWRSWGNIFDFNHRPCKSRG